MNIEKNIKTTSELPLSKKLVLGLIISGNLVNEQIMEALKAYDISIPQFNVLRILRGQKGKPANLSTIQERMVSKMSNTTRIVDKLIAKCFVERTTCEENRRKVEIIITEEGLKFLSTIDPVVTETEEKIASALTKEETKQLISLINKLTQ